MVERILPWAEQQRSSAKSIVKIGFGEIQTATFCKTLAPEEYPFWSNVKPTVAHPHWSRMTERLIDSGVRLRLHVHRKSGSAGSLGSLILQSGNPSAGHVRLNFGPVLAGDAGGLNGRA